MEISEIKEHFNKISGDYDYWKKKNYYYYNQLKDFYKRNILSGEAILEIGCGTGSVLNEVVPKKACGLT